MPQPRGALVCPSGDWAGNIDGAPWESSPCCAPTRATTQNSATITTKAWPQTVHQEVANLTTELEGSRFHILWTLLKAEHQQVVAELRSLKDPFVSGQPGARGQPRERSSDSGTFIPTRFSDREPLLQPPTATRGDHSMKTGALEHQMNTLDSKFSHFDSQSSYKHVSFPDVSMGGGTQHAQLATVVDEDKFRYPDNGVSTMQSNQSEDASRMQWNTSQSSVKSDDGLAWKIKNTWTVMPEKPFAKRMLSSSTTIVLDGTQRIVAPSKSTVERAMSDTALLPPDDDVVEQYHGFFRCLVSQPGCRKRIAWDIFGAAFVLYDLIWIPIKVFDPPENLFTISMGWTTLIFWTINMMASPFMGFFKDGMIIMSPSRIGHHYLRGWFWIDVIVIFPDWLYTLEEHSGGGGSAMGGISAAMRELRFLRIFRLLRLTRIVRLKELMGMINDLFDSEYVSVFIAIVRMVLLLMAINHLLACCWFAVAKWGDDAGLDTWVKVHQFADEDWFYLYLTSFHWSITQFTPSSMHVQPQNIRERGFAICVIIFALIGFSYVVGSITSSLGQLRGMQENAIKQFWMLRGFLRQNKVEPELSTRVQKYLEHAWQKQQKRVPKEQIALFKLLSDQLKNELEVAMLASHINIHPMLDHFSRISPVTMQRLATTAISANMLARGDAMFHAGEKAHSVYFVTIGRLQYIKVNQSGEMNADSQEYVDHGEDWIAEPVLWAREWIHLGVLVAVLESELLLVETEAFFKAVVMNPEVHEQTVEFAEHYIKWMNERDPSSMSDICQGEDMTDLLVSFLPEEAAVARQASRNEASCFM